MTTTPIIRVSADSSRAEIAEAIAALRGKQMRLPLYWTDKRAEIGDEIDLLVDQWLAAGV